MLMLLIIIISSNGLLMATVSFLVRKAHFMSNVSLIMTNNNDNCGN